MKNILIAAILIIVTITCSYAQQQNDFFADKSQQDIIAWQKTIGDKRFNDAIDAGLKVGDKMPDLPLGTVMNYDAGKAKFSDLKGKPVILDFWSTGCITCMAMFPKMEKLQKQLGDKVQIFLVNVSETRQQIEERMKKMNKKMPDLPCIAGPRQDLRKLFSIFYVPHHAWIDQEGIVRVTGDYTNTYADKIADLLNGKEIASFNGTNTTPEFNAKIPYYQLMEKSINPVVYNSWILPFNPFYASSCVTGGKVICTVDSSNNTKRSTYINIDVGGLYQSIFKEELNRERKKILYSPGSVGEVSGYASVILTVKDTFRYTSHLLDYKELTDRIVKKSRFCYEQVAPASWSNNEMRMKMLNDLNNYFGKRYGLKVSIENIDTTCYVLVRTSDVDKLSHTNKTNSKSNIEILVSATPSVRMLFNKAIYDQKVIPATVFNDASTGRSCYFLNETNFVDKNYESGKGYFIDFPKKGQIKTLADLRKLLKKYDLDIIKAKRKLAFMVMKDDMKDD